MKRIAFLATSAALTVLMFVAVVYTSCTKSNDNKTTPPAVVDKCLGVTCRNTGICSDGNCTCPTGYSGHNCEISRIAFRNRTPTPVTLKVNDTSYTIAVNDSVYLYDTSGTSADISVKSTNSWDTLSWNYSLNFPNDGILIDRNLDAANTYFYLKMINNSPKSITKFIINLTQAYETFSYVAPNDGHSHDIGYFRYNGSISLGILFGDGSFQTYTGTLPNTVNQVYTFTLN